MHSCLAKGQEKRLLFLCFQVDRMPVSAAKSKPTIAGINGARGTPGTQPFVVLAKSSHSGEFTCFSLRKRG